MLVGHCSCLLTRWMYWLFFFFNLGVLFLDEKSALDLTGTDPSLQLLDFLSFSVGKNMNKTHINQSPINTHTLFRETKPFGVVFKYSNLPYGHFYSTMYYTVKVMCNNSSAFKGQVVLLALWCCICFVHAFLGIRVLKGSLLSIGNKNP